MNVKIIGECRVLKDVLIGDKSLPVANLKLVSNFNDGTKGLIKLELGIFVDKLEFNDDAKLTINGIVLGTENERKIYEQLKEKFEPLQGKSLIEETKSILDNLSESRDMYINTRIPIPDKLSQAHKAMAHVVFCLKEYCHLENKQSEGNEWISTEKQLPLNGSKVQTLHDGNYLLHGNYMIDAIFIDNSFFRDADNVLILPLPTHWRYKK